VVADFGGDASGPGATTHHLPGIRSVEPLAVELRLPTTIGARFNGLEEGNSRDFETDGVASTQAAVL
jgi:hypothetical protein